MNKKILNEIGDMKYLFGYKRGVVISEQNVSTTGGTQQMAKYILSLKNPQNENDKIILWDGSKQVLDAEKVKLLQGEMGIENPTGIIDNSNFDMMKSYMQTSIDQKQIGGYGMGREGTTESVPGAEGWHYDVKPI